MAFELLLRSHLLKGKHILDKPGIFNSALVKQEFLIEFLGNNKLRLKQTDLLNNIYFVHPDFDIVEESDHYIKATNLKNKFELFSKAEEYIELQINDHGSDLDYFYQLSIKNSYEPEREISEVFIVTATKYNGNISAKISDGYFSKIQIDLAVIKIKKKLIEIKYADFTLKDHGTFNIKVMFYKEEPHTAVKLENDGFSWQEINLTLGKLFSK